MCVVGQLGKPSPGLELTYGKTCTWYGTLCWSKLIQSKECERFWKKTFFSLDELQEMLKFKETLEVMEARQRRKRGLLHILDEVYLFFMELEQRKVDLLNVYVLRKQHENMVEAATCSLTRDKELKGCWMQCFPSDEVDRSEVCNMCLTSTIGYKVLVNFGLML